MENINYDNFDLQDIVQKRNDVIDLKHNLQEYVQRLRKYQNNMEFKEKYVLKGGGFFSTVASIISPFIRNIIKILSPVIGILPGGGNILEILENLNTISSKIEQMEKTFASWEKNTTLNKALFGKFKKTLYLLNKTMKVFVSEKMEIDPIMIDIAQTMQQINKLKSDMKGLKEQGEQTLNQAQKLSEMDSEKLVAKAGTQHLKNTLKGKGSSLQESSHDMVSKELELDKLKLKLDNLVKENDLKGKVEKLKKLVTSPQGILTAIIQIAVLSLPIPGIALVPKLQMITQDILRAQENVMDILDSASTIVFSYSVCDEGVTYLTDNGSCKCVLDDIYDTAIDLKTLLPFFVESEKGKKMVGSLEPHYQSVRPGNIRTGDDVLKLLINLIIRFVRHGKTEEIVALLDDPNALKNFRSLKKTLFKFEKFPYKWPIGFKVEDYILELIKGIIDQDPEMQQFFAKIAKQLSSTPQNLESLIQMLLDSQGIKKDERLEKSADMARKGAYMARTSAAMARTSADMAKEGAAMAGAGKVGGKKYKKRSRKKVSRKTVKSKRKGKYTRKR